MSHAEKNLLDHQFEEFIKLLDLPERPGASTKEEPKPLSVVPSTLSTTENETAANSDDVLLGIDLNSLLDSSLSQALSGAQDSYNPPSTPPAVDCNVVPVMDSYDWMAINNQPRTSTDHLTKPTPELLLALNQSLVARVRALEQWQSHAEQIMAEYGNWVKKTEEHWKDTTHLVSTIFELVKSHNEPSGKSRAFTFMDSTYSHLGDSRND
ncbi:hypothetical protein B0T10DRAFT_577424 [Thelonectria olida]|uniref:Uncharacterized protein n=1 Tax=Thelonectria olida TaxID=1576542 RepID=A0A9P9APR3_9HYPO|nr:hypothetical protein B0T10DRAFT_577424 [Thelonectria olida]